ncbi:hypothetical protein [Pantoea stewartii]|uniref:hypothetical protein n=1 Tax=Pantoea stewartii TaxID=66269 RepID=UPI0037043838
MQKISAYTTTADDDNEFTDGSVTGGQSPTNLVAAWFNMVQRELIAIPAAASISLDTSNDKQLLAALRAMFLQTGNCFSEIKAAGTTAVATALANLGDINGLRLLSDWRTYPVAIRYVADHGNVGVFAGAVIRQNGIHPNGGGIPDRRSA